MFLIHFLIHFDSFEKSGYFLKTIPQGASTPSRQVGGHWRGEVGKPAGRYAPGPVSPRLLDQHWDVRASKGHEFWKLFLFWATYDGLLGRHRAPPVSFQTRDLNADVGGHDSVGLRVLIFS